MRRIARLLAVTTLALTFSPLGQAEACATGHLGIRWGFFPPLVGEFGPVFLYWVVEPGSGSTTVPLTIRAADEGSCSTPAQPAQATYAVDTPVGTNRPATPGPAQDYDSIPVGNTGPLYDHRQPPNFHTFNVTVHSDGPLPEPVVEQARARITVTDGIPEPPQNVPMYIVDADGLSRASLENSGPYQQQEAFREVVIPVFRAGDASQQATFDYTVQGTSAAPATAGSDFSITSPQPLVFPPGQRASKITLALVPDGVTEPTEELTVALTNAATVDPSDPVSATVQILNSAGSGLAPPTSDIHHPRDGLRYRKTDYRIREIHAFTKRGGAGAVQYVDLAIRMNRKNGNCAWYSPKGFNKGDCTDPRWIKSDGKYEADLFYFRMKRLRPSVKKIKNYTAMTRAIDAGGVEQELVKGRNLNDFEVRRAKKRKKR